MKKDDLIKQDEKILFAREWLLLNLQDYMLERGINHDDIFLSELDYIMVKTDENYNNHAVIEKIRECNLESIEIDDSSDKASIISLK